MTANSMASESRRERLRQLAVLYLKLGVTGFGGPAATIAMMEDEVVRRRGWLTPDYFLDVVGSTNLVPGPNAMEVAIHVGRSRAGWRGMLVAGACFAGPAVLLSGLLGWAYQRYGTLPSIEPVLRGIKPAVLAVIVAAVGRLGRTAVKGWRLAVLGAAVLVASLLGVNEILALFGGGLLGMAWLQAERLKGHLRGSGPTTLGLLGLPLILPRAQIWAAATPPTLWRLALFFGRVGAVLYGSGYVLIAFLQGGLVDQYGWLTQQQLLDAIAAGQLTPGPLTSTASFVGYLLLGIPGAAVSTIAIYLPSFIIVALVSRWLPRLRRSPWAASFLDAINVCAVGLMAAVAVKLGLATLTTWPAVAIGLLAALVGLRWRVNSAWLVLGGALAGWVVSLW